MSKYKYKMKLTLQKYVNNLIFKSGPARVACGWEETRHFEKCPENEENLTQN